MFTLTIQDRNGVPLNHGDLVIISDGRYLKFISEVKWLKEERALAPFHTFSFHSVEKISELPSEAVKLDEERYNVWYLPSGTKDIEERVNHAEKYLIEWRSCERAIDKRIFVVDLIE